MIYETVHAVYFAMAIVATIVTATWSLHRRISGIELKVEAQTGVTNTAIAEVRGSIEVLSVRLDQANGHTPAQPPAKRKR